MHLFTQIATRDGLQQGWERVLGNSDMAGVDGVSVPMFALRIDQELAQLVDELNKGTYKPGPLFGFDIPKPTGGTRRLGVPNVRDRVVQSAALVFLQPLVEKELEASTFAYRPGRSYKTAIEKIRFLRDQGYTWVVDADIHAYFDEIDHALLLERLREVVPDEALIRLIHSWLGVDMVLDGQRITRKKGLPQGSVLSPLLANLYLDDLDEEIEKQGYKLVRYADDFVILCKSERRAHKAMEMTEDMLEALELRLNTDKTQVVHFDQGFRFLGSLFVRSLIVPSEVKRKSTDAIPVRQPVKRTFPPAPEQAELEETAIGRAFGKALKEEGVTMAEFVDRMVEPVRTVKPIEQPVPAEVEPVHEEDDEAEGTERVSTFRRTLYIQEQGSVLRMIRGRFVVTDGKAYNKTILSIPAIKVEQVIVFGHCMLTPAATQHCLKEEIPVTFLSSQGAYFGQLESTTSANVKRQRLQFLHSLDVEKRLMLARSIVEAKLYNTRSVLRRYARKTEGDALTNAAEELTRLQRKLVDAEGFDQVRGYEGRGSAVYFGVFDQLLERSDFTFSGRNRQPPLDPVNAMLSFGYTLLFYNIYALVRVHRLNPYVGVFHEERAGHPALVSDLVEEFRFVVERMVLGMSNQRRFVRTDFYHPEDRPGCFLTSEARKTFLRAFEKAMRQEVTHPLHQQVLSYRRCIDVQVRGYAAYLEGKGGYVPFVIK